MQAVPVEHNCHSVCVIRTKGFSSCYSSPRRGDADKHSSGECKEQCLLDYTMYVNASNVMNVPFKYLHNLEDNCVVFQLFESVATKKKYKPTCSLLTKSSKEFSGCEGALPFFSKSQPTVSN